MTNKQKMEWNKLKKKGAIEYSNNPEYSWNKLRAIECEIGIGCDPLTYHDLKSVGTISRQDLQFMFIVHRNK